MNSEEMMSIVEHGTVSVISYGRSGDVSTTEIVISDFTFANDKDSKNLSNMEEALQWALSLISDGIQEIKKRREKMEGER